MPGFKRSDIVKVDTRSDLKLYSAMANTLKILVIGITVLMLGASAPIWAATSEEFKPPVKMPTVAQVSAAFDQVLEYAHMADAWFTEYVTDPLFSFFRSVKRLVLGVRDLYGKKDEIESAIRSKMKYTCGFFMVKYFATEICAQ